jgi:hypothetical protein
MTKYKLRDNSRSLFYDALRVFIFVHKEATIGFIYFYLNQYF